MTKFKRSEWKPLCPITMGIKFKFRYRFYFLKYPIEMYTIHENNFNENMGLKFKNNNQPKKKQTKTIEK